MHDSTIHLETKSDPTDGFIPNLRAISYFSFYLNTLHYIFELSEYKVSKDQNHPQFSVLSLKISKRRHRVIHLKF